MGGFERWRLLRRAICLLVLALPLAATAQPTPCSRLPQVQQAQARESGLCIDDSAAAAAKKTQVTLDISDGSIVTVPPLRGVTLADARAALQRAGDLHAATPTGDEPGTMLVDTSAPVAGLRVQRGSTVSLTLVPLAPWRAWAAGFATLLVLGGAGLYRWRQSRLPGARTGSPFRPGH